MAKKVVICILGLVIGFTLSTTLINSAELVEQYNYIQELQEDIIILEEQIINMQKQLD